MKQSIKEQAGDALVADLEALRIARMKELMIEQDKLDAKYSRDTWRINERMEAVPKLGVADLRPDYDTATGMYKTSDGQTIYHTAR